MRYLLIICAVLALVASASAGTSKSVFKSKRLCTAAQYQTAAVPASGNVTVSVSVAGKHINGVAVNRHTVEWSGHGVIVRIVQRSGIRAPLYVRAASVRDGCVTVNLLAKW